MSEMIDITGLDKAVLLAALYNRSKPQGLGILHARPGDMTPAEATTHLSTGPYFDYLGGRVLKVDLGGDTLNPWLYDRDNGSGAAARVVEQLRAELEG